MNLNKVKELAGHREVPAWVLKLVMDAVAYELKEANQRKRELEMQCKVPQQTKSKE